MAAPYEGGCACGEVRYRLNTEPFTLYACHCRGCQVQSGSAFGLSMPVMRDAVELLRGQPVGYEFERPGGIKKRAWRCPSCNARLWGEPVRLPEFRILRPGTLDDHSWVGPVGHIWTREAQPWVRIPDDVLRYPGQPGDLTELVRAWHDREILQ